MNKDYRDYISEEFKNLTSTIGIIGDALDKTTLDKLQIAGLGACLADMYKGYENIFRAFLEDKGRKIPKSERWHSDLLGFSKREGLIPDEMGKIVRGMLSFRHLQVHGYAHMLDENELRTNSAEVVKNHPIFEKHIMGIIETDNGDYQAVTS